MPEESKHRALRAETVGILVLALLLAIMLLVRWGGLIPWSAR